MQPLYLKVMNTEEDYGESTRHIILGYILSDISLVFWSLASQVQCEGNTEGKNIEAKFVKHFLSTISNLVVLLGDQVRISSEGSRAQADTFTGQGSLNNLRLILFPL